jgi:hypothetical protein
MNYFSALQMAAEAAPVSRESVRGGWSKKGSWRGGAESTIFYDFSGLFSPRPGVFGLSVPTPGKR